MAKFCGKCGAQLDEITGLCPNCHRQPELPKPQPADTPSAKRERQSTLKKGKPAGKLLLTCLLALVLLTGVLATLVYFDVVEIPAVNSLFVRLGWKEGEPMYQVTPPDADEYYGDNGKIVSQAEAKDSKNVRTEAQACADLTDRGFTQNPITWDYSMDGTYQGEGNADGSSSQKHPTYETYYITAAGDIWLIFQINGKIMANPVSYNLQSGRDVPVMLSESGTVMSYDGTTNRFYETVPDRTAMLLKTVNKIDAQTLETLTAEEIDGL